MRSIKEMQSHRFRTIGKILFGMGDQERAHEESSDEIQHFS